MAYRGKNMFGKFMGELHYMGELKSRSYQGGGGFRNALSSNLNTVNLNTVPNHGGIQT